MTARTAPDSLAALEAEGADDMARAAPDSLAALEVAGADDMARAAPDSLAALEAEVCACRRCPRLVDWREEVAREKRAAFRDWDYWGRGLPGFGDPSAAVVLVGLAPAAHGGNRTGRFFTGDRSADFLLAGLHRTGFANQPTSERKDDGLALTGCWITAAVRCPPPANRPTPQERDACRPWLERELVLLPRARVFVCLGAFAWDATLRLLAALGEPAPRPRPRFGHGAELPGSRWTLVGAFHPSQQNTFTGKLTPAMLDTVLARARVLAGPADTVSVPHSRNIPVTADMPHTPVTP